MDDSNLRNQQTRNIQENFVVYYWTNLALPEQGHGLEQQRQDFTLWLQQNGHQASQVIAEFTDKFLKRTKPKHFPELSQAVDASLKNNACLVVTELDKLLGQQEFAELLHTKGLKFICLDNSSVTPESLSTLREYINQQREKHGSSIKKGLRLSPNKLGNPNAAKSISPFNRIKTENAIMFALLLSPVIEVLKQESLSRGNKALSQRGMVDALNHLGVLAPEGKPWVLSQLQKVLKRIDANNLALGYTNQVTKNDYQNYSSAELISSLNSCGFKPYHQEQWDEEALSQVQKRSRTINNVLELYAFMQEQESTVSDCIAEGQTLEQIAEQLNHKGLAIPQVIKDSVDVRQTHDQRPQEVTWNIMLVEELVKRMSNAVKLRYSDDVMQNYSELVQQYAQSETNLKIKEVYQNKVVQNIIQESVAQDSHNPRFPAV